ncbi:hypothetical protein GCM10008018_16710 [Paenibacillus marchantiophytorum]|uniref:Uncharacterized protein n=1 Tax=Paenibacillus marchantiophytorum TaxID=1619310 RepID=A0ABQ2BUT9_9BACL|nr:hypothetical protein GCM10008018_16710 [Paenibacillus marchantiophytorum]
MMRNLYHIRLVWWVAAAMLVSTFIATGSILRCYTAITRGIGPVWNPAGATWRSVLSRLTKGTA